jgi:hypothetical protein
LGERASKNSDKKALSSSALPSLEINNSLRQAKHTLRLLTCRLAMFYQLNSKNLSEVNDAKWHVNGKIFSTIHRPVLGRITKYEPKSF